MEQDCPRVNEGPFPVVKQTNVINFKDARQFKLGNTYKSVNIRETYPIMFFCVK